jgi:hypothetical protein
MRLEVSWRHQDGTHRHTQSTRAHGCNALTCARSSKPSLHTTFTKRVMPAVSASADLPDDGPSLEPRAVVALANLRHGTVNATSPRRSLRRQRRT